jgi:hypothetical protein
VEKFFKARLNFGKVIITTIIVALIILSVIFFLKDNEQKPVEKFVNTVKESEVVVEKKPEKISLEITAIELTWVSVSIDDGKPKEWLLRTGETVTVMSSEKFAVKIGNAGGTKLVFNGEDLGKLGDYGKVADIVLSKNSNE